jgi:hypothetical protein
MVLNEKPGEDLGRTWGLPGEHLTLSLVFIELYDNMAARN